MNRLSTLWDRGAQAFGAPKWLAAALAAALLAGAFLLSQTPRPCDDAYITFRHVRHLVEHGVPAWNLEGPRVLGSTTPAYLFLLGAFSLLTGLRDLPWAALILNALLHAWTVAVVILLAQRSLKRPLPALLTGLLVGFNAVYVYIGSQGFESALFIAVIFTVFLCLDARCDATAVLLTSIAPLVRPEGLLLSAITWGFLLATKRITLRLVILYALAPALWFAFATGYYGSCIPHSIRAKQHSSVIFTPYAAEPYSLARNLIQWPHTAWAYAYTWAPKIIFNGAVYEPWGHPLRAVIAAAALAAAPAAAWVLVKRRGPILLCLAWAVLNFAFYALIQAHSLWYLPAYTVTAVAFLFAGACALLDSVTALRPDGRMAICFRPLCIALFLSLFLLNRYTYHRGELPESRPWIYARDCGKGDWSGMEWERYHAYRDAAEFLNGRVERDDATVLISEVGVFGYFYKGPVLDSGALCSPEVLPFYPPPPSDLFDEDGALFTASNHTPPSRLVAAFLPEYVVNCEVYLYHVMREGTVLTDRYRCIARRKPIWRAPVAVYERVKPPIGPSSP